MAHRGRFEHPRPHPHPGDGGPPAGVATPGSPNGKPGDIVTIAELVPVLQTAIGPVILISGIGLLLLTMTNRYGRVIDRSRSLILDLANASGEEAGRLRAQILILWRRARIIRYVIALASISALTAALLIIFLFITAFWKVEEAWIIGGLFITCLGSLIASLLLFLYDIDVSLAALKLELDAEGLGMSNIS